MVSEVLPFEATRFSIASGFLCWPTTDVKVYFDKSKKLNQDSDSFHFIKFECDLSLTRIESLSSSTYFVNTLETRLGISETKVLA